MKFGTRYEKTRPKAFRCFGVERTKQAHKEECDINHILKRYKKTGMLPAMIKGNPAFGDFSGVEDFQRSLEIVALAEEQFAALPAAVRRRFGNSPEGFLAFAQDAKNGPEMARMGLCKPQEGEGGRPAAPGSSRAVKGSQEPLSPKEPKGSKKGPEGEAVG